MLFFAELRRSFAALLFLIPALARSQDFEPVHAEAEWFTIETEHFLVHFHKGANRTAADVARIAERIYKPVTDLYDHRPDQKVSFVIRDHDDLANGGAYFYDNKIEISAMALNYELRGTHPWLWDVITHEFTHIVQIQTAMKFGRRFPAVYLQWLGYERERRPDVLYGFPNVLVSYPLSGFIVPPWFAEGTAQYNVDSLNFDYWDTHRDMILRMYFLEGKPLSWQEMSVFGKNSLGNESVYNSGFSMVRYIAQTYGEERLNDLSRALSKPLRVSFDGAVEEVLGISAEELYDNWVQSETEGYVSFVDARGAESNVGRYIEREGFGNYYPAFSPDGARIAYISTKGADYFSLSSLYLYDVATNQTELIMPGVRSSVSFSPDGKYLYYAKLTDENKHSSRVHDIYRYNLAEREEQRLTFGIRAQDPKLSPDGSLIAFVYSSDGNANIGVVDADGSGFRSVTSFSKGEQAYNPNWSPDGKFLTFAYSVNFRRSIAMIKTDGTEIKNIDGGDFDARDPVFSRDGNSLIYASDESQVFNLYQYNLLSGEKKQLTNLRGGAFLPDIDEKGNIVYAGYKSDGYKIFFISAASSDTAMKSVILSGNGNSFFKNGETPPRVAQYTMPLDTSGVHVTELRPYRSVFTSLSIIPVIRFENYNRDARGLDLVKPGIFFYSSDVLGKLSLFGGANMNRSFERDLFFTVEYRDKLPGLYQIGLEPSLSLELYNISRKTRVDIDLTPYIVSTEVTYNLLEFSARMKHPVVNTRNMMEAVYTFSRYDANIGSFVNPNTNSVQPSFRNTYLTANSFSLRYIFNGIVPSVDMAINPVGTTLSVRYSFEGNRFNGDGEFEIKNGLLVPIYKWIPLHRLEATSALHIGLMDGLHTLSLSLRGGSILGNSVDSFFDFYAGGFIGMRGYPFYALGGNEFTTFGTEYRLPIVRNLDAEFLQFQFRKIYFSLFADLGSAWNGRIPASSDWKKDMGVELRVDAFSFYAYPTRIFLSAAYGFDKFETTFNETKVAYGKEWLFYLGILFTFEIMDVFSPHTGFRSPVRY